MGIVSRLSTGKALSLAGIWIVCAKHRQFSPQGPMNGGSDSRSPYRSAPAPPAPGPPGPLLTGRPDRTNARHADPATNAANSVTAVHFAPLHAASWLRAGPGTGRASRWRPMSICFCRSSADCAACAEKGTAAIAAAIRVRLNMFLPFPDTRLNK